MSTSIRPEVSLKNEFYVKKERVKELEWFCKQYGTWKEARKCLMRLKSRPDDLQKFKSNEVGNPTERCALAIAKYGTMIAIVEEAARCASEDLWQQILLSVTEGQSYEKVKARIDIPCGRDTFYFIRRKFFWVVDKLWFAAVPEEKVTLKIQHEGA